MTEGMSRKRTGKIPVISACIACVLGLMAACSGAAAPMKEVGVLETTVAAVATETTNIEDTEESLAAMEEIMEETMAVTTAETVREATEESETETQQSGSEESEVEESPRRPAGHQIVYSDGEIYGWTRYEYDENGRKDMVIFIAPNGNEYWSPVFYDGNGHVIPENVGSYSLRDENDLLLEVGTEDNRGRRTPMVEYDYDERGNLTDYWYMYVSGKYMRHVKYAYDSHDHLIREEVYYTRNDRLESYVEYIYNGQCQLIRKNEVEDVKQGTVVYTLYQYNENGHLIREEMVWGGRTHDYVDYYYNEAAELIREYHFLEDKMMGGPYTVEYLFEAIDDSAG